MLDSSTGGFYEAIRSLQEMTQAKLDQQQLAAQHTSNVIVQRTKGAGYTDVTVAFDVVFLDEPAFSYGATVPSTTSKSLAVGSGHVSAWVRDTKGRYTGAVVRLTVDVRRTETGGRALATSVVVAHNLSFGALAAHETIDDKIAALLQTTQPVQVDI